jgi:hypothetical protein
MNEKDSASGQIIIPCSTSSESIPGIVFIFYHKEGVALDMY